MSSSDMVGALSQHPVYGSRVRDLLNSGAQPDDIVNAIASSQAPPSPPKQFVPHATGGRLNDPINRNPPSGIAGAIMQPYAMMGNGAERIYNAQDPSDVAGGISDIARGGMAWGAPAVLPAALAAAPVATAAGMAGGAIAGTGAEMGLKAMGAPQGFAELGGTAAGIGAGAWAGYEASQPKDLGPHIAATRAWGFEKNPKIFDELVPQYGQVKLTSALSDLKPAMQAGSGQVGSPQGGWALGAGAPATTGTGPSGRIVGLNGFAANADGEGPFFNEAVIRQIPGVLDENRDAWDQWKARSAGQYRDGTPVVNATAAALKNTISDPRAQAIVDEAQRVYGKNLSADELESLLIEKNAELKQFYSQNPDVQAAAERAGADTLKSKALLEAQARAIRESLYNLMDPEGGGAGPRELQARYGALKAIQDAANDPAKRQAILATHPVDVPEQAVGSGQINPVAAVKARRQDPEWLIQFALNNAENPSPLPVPTKPYPFNPRGLPGASRGIGAPQVAPYSSGTTGGMPPAWQANQWQNVNGPRQLPAGSYPFTQGISVPDLAGNIQQGYGETIRQPRGLPAGSPQFTQGTSVPDMTAPAPQIGTPRLAPGQSIRPPSELSGQAGDITDVIPVRDAQGNISYAPRASAPQPRVTPETLASRMAHQFYKLLGGPGGSQ
jgi:hypothetical protein